MAWPQLLGRNAAASTPVLDGVQHAQLRSWACRLEVAVLHAGFECRAMVSVSGEPVVDLHVATGDDDAINGAISAVQGEGAPAVRIVWDESTDLHFAVVA